MINILKCLSDILSPYQYVSLYTSICVRICIVVDLHVFFVRIYRCVSENEYICIGVFLWVYLRVYVWVYIFVCAPLCSMYLCAFDYVYLNVDSSYLIIRK